MFAVGTFDVDGVRTTGLVVDDHVHDLRDEFGDDVTTKSLLEDWDASFAAMSAWSRRVDPRAGTPFAEVTPLPPVQPTGELWCAGANYYAHTVEMSVTLMTSDPDGTRTAEEIHDEAVGIADRVREGGRPFVFSGQTSALVGSDADVVLWGPGVEHDWELEIGVVIGRTAQHVAVDDAMEHVAAYTIANDVSTRDVMFRPGFALTDFVMSKGRPTFFPLGPYLVPAAFVPDYRALELDLRVNGEVMQRGRCDDMIFGIEELVSYLSDVTVLRPGDVVLTGTPAGNAAAHGGRWLRPGDLMEGRVSGLGTLRNRCVADPRA